MRVGCTLAWDHNFHRAIIFDAMTFIPHNNLLPPQPPSTLCVTMQHLEFARSAPSKGHSWHARAA
eukprot:2143568-Amphidinium_carterae.1